MRIHVGLGVALILGGLVATQQGPDPWDVEGSALEATGTWVTVGLGAVLALLGAILFISRRP